MSTTQSTESVSKITDHREVVIRRVSGAARWEVDEFNHGRAYMLTVHGDGGLRFQAHFDREQFRALQAMLAAGYEDET
jgi:hypothetical protein